MINGLRQKVCYKVKNLIYTLIFLPMPFIWGMFFVILVASREKIVFFFKIIFALLLIFSLPLFNTILEYPLKNFNNNYDMKQKVSLVLVPTAGIYKDPFGIWHASNSTVFRTISGYNLARNIGVPLVISGGQTKNNSPAESYIAKKYLFEENSVIIETESKNSFQTAYNLKNIVKSYKLDNGIIVVSTSPIHNLRMNLVLRSNGFNAKNILIEEPKKNYFLQLIPHSGSFLRINGSIYEYLGIIEYIFKGYINYKAFFK